MKTAIYEILKISKTEYEMFRDSLYLNWADEHSVSTMHLQSIMSSQKVYAWFSREYENKEKAFLETLKQVYQENPKVSIQSVRQLYDKYTSEIRFYPKVLINKCKPKQIIRIPQHNIIQNN